MFWIGLITGLAIAVVAVVLLLIYWLGWIGNLFDKLFGQ